MNNLNEMPIEEIEEKSKDTFDVNIELAKAKLGLPKEATHKEVEAKKIAQLSELLKRLGLTETEIK